MIKPKIALIATEEPLVQFARVDVDKNEETSTLCDITCMPTFIFYKNGKKIDEIQGADLEGLRNKIDLYKENRQRQIKTQGKSKYLSIHSKQRMTQQVVNKEKFVERIKNDKKD